MRAAPRARHWSARSARGMPLRQDRRTASPLGGYHGRAGGGFKVRRKRVQQGVDERQVRESAPSPRAGDSRTPWAGSRAWAPRGTLAKSGGRAGHTDGTHRDGEDNEDTDNDVGTGKIMRGSCTLVVTARAGRADLL